MATLRAGKPVINKPEIHYISGYHLINTRTAHMQQFYDVKEDN